MDGSQREFVTTSRGFASLSRQLDGVSRRSVSLLRGKTCLLN